MSVPVRLLAAAKPTVPSALLVAIATSTAVFTATPFFLSSVAEQYDVAIGTAGLTSTAQLGGFVVASWVGGRFLHPVRGIFVIGTLLGVVSNFGSAVAPAFELLVALRFVSGLSLGFAAWIAWQAAFGHPGRSGEVAVVGPLVGVVASPLIAIVLQSAGLNWLFVVLGFITALPLDLHPSGSPPRPPPSAPHPPRRDACGEGDPVRAHPAHARRIVGVRLCGSDRRGTRRTVAAHGVAALQRQRAGIDPVGAMDRPSRAGRHLVPDDGVVRPDDRAVAQRTCCSGRR